MCGADAVESLHDNVESGGCPSLRVRLFRQFSAILGNSLYSTYIKWYETPSCVANNLFMISLYAISSNRSATHRDFRQSLDHKICPSHHSVRLVPTCKIYNLVAFKSIKIFHCTSSHWFIQTINSERVLLWLNSNNRNPILAISPANHAIPSTPETIFLLTVQSHTPTSTSTLALSIPTPTRDPRQNLHPLNIPPTALGVVSSACVYLPATRIYHSQVASPVTCRVSGSMC